MQACVQATLLLVFYHTGMDVKGFCFCMAACIGIINCKCCKKTKKMYNLRNWSRFLFYINDGL